MRLDPFSYQCQLWCMFTREYFVFLHLVNHASQELRFIFLLHHLIECIGFIIIFSFTFQACERAIDVDNEFITSEIDSSYPQCSKDSVLNNTLSETPQTTLYELLEYAKSRSILRNNIQNSTSNSHPSGFSIRTMNSVHFNQHSQNLHLQSLSCENSSLKTNKKVPIRISSLKRESKTAQTLR